MNGKLRTESLKTELKLACSVVKKESKYRELLRKLAKVGSPAIHILAALKVPRSIFMCVLKIQSTINMGGHGFNLWLSPVCFLFDLIIDSLRPINSFSVSKGQVFLD